MKKQKLKFVEDDYNTVAIKFGPGVSRNRALELVINMGVDEFLGTQDGYIVLRLY